MPPLIDLHTHSTYSDGTLSPRELISAAAQRGLQALALTDHDTMAGIGEAVEQGKLCDVAILPGLEISAHHQTLSIHILGYGVNRNAVLLKKTLQNIQDARHTRNMKIFERLSRFAPSLSYEQLPQKEYGQIGRPHIAKLLVDQGIVRSENEAFARFLKKNAAAYVQREILPVEIAIETIVQAGGLAIMAHPGSLAVSQGVLATLIKQFHDKGLSGVEVYHPLHSEKNILFLEKVCHNQMLLMTGGSDFHGRGRDKASLGEYGNQQPVPFTLFEKLTEQIPISHEHDSHR